ncbi:MAG: pilin [Candidatus Daviesbacteria bacterium]|nr:pilin [Candidatus Daviesbacteria bacterium]
MKKIIYTSSLLLTALIVTSPVFAASADVSKIQSFIQNIIQIFVTLAGLVATAFLVWGGFRYMTSSGNPEALDGAKKTVMYSAIGLAIVLGAYVLSNIITQVATSAFGTI